MAGKKSGHLGSEVALLQYGLADESIQALHAVSQTAFAKQYVGWQNATER
jgi:hypothetical protein